MISIDVLNDEELKLGEREVERKAQFFNINVKTVFKMTLNGLETERKRCT